LMGRFSDAKKLWEERMRVSEQCERERERERRMEVE
jgi:hypothetical protein